MMIPFPPFEPDKSPFEGGATAVATNVLPVANGWGPCPSLTEISQALPSTCLGAVYVRNSSGTYRIIAGTETNLYALDPTDFSWEDISGPSAPYAVPLGDHWTFTQFGDLLIAHTLGDPIQSYNIESATDFADLAGSPPRARYSWVASDFLVLGYTDGTYGEKTVRWSGLNDPEYWVIGKKGSDYQELPEGGEVMGGFGEQGGFYVIQRSGMQTFGFAPTSGFTFTRTVLNPKQGSIAPRSIVSNGPSTFFYLSDDGFFNGVARTPIGAERVDRWFMQQVDKSYLSDVQGSVDPFEKIIWWRFRAVNTMYYRIGYDWQLDRWCYNDLEVGEMVSMTTPGFTWDSLDMLYANIDEANEPFDSRLFAGGTPTFATFTNDNKLAYFSGSPLAATVDTAHVEIDDMNRSFVSGGRVVTDATNFTVTDSVRAFHGQEPVIGTANVPNSRTGKVPFRSDGRLHCFTWKTEQGEDWSILTSINVDARRSGEN